MVITKCEPFHLFHPILRLVETRRRPLTVAVTFDTLRLSNVARAPRLGSLRPDIGDLTTISGIEKDVENL